MIQANNCQQRCSDCQSCWIHRSICVYIHTHSFYQTHSLRLFLERSALHFSQSSDISSQNHAHIPACRTFGMSPDFKSCVLQSRDLYYMVRKNGTETTWWITSIEQTLWRYSTTIAICSSTRLDRHSTGISLCSSRRSWWSLWLLTPDMIQFVCTARFCEVVKKQCRLMVMVYSDCA